MNASPEDWTAFTDSITNAAHRGGLTRADAEDVAQDIALRIVEGRFAKNAENLRQAFGTARRIARKAGTWAVLGGQARRDRDRYNRARKAEGFQFPTTDDPTYPSPARMAAAAEAKCFPVARIHEAYGIGPTALAEPGTTPSVCGSGPGWTMPEPIPADRYPTDPNPIGRIVAALAVANDARRVAGLPPIR
jgi:hypothetical protein